MSKRHKLGSSESKRMFSKHGAKTHSRNVQRPGASRNPMRGGIRL